MEKRFDPDLTHWRPVPHDEERENARQSLSLAEDDLRLMWLAWLCRIPAPGVTAEGDDRFYNRDLAGMTREELLSEQFKARNRLEYDDRPDAQEWLADRLQAIEGCLNGRRQSA